MNERKTQLSKYHLNQVQKGVNSWPENDTLKNYF